jgi:hypothetical protein
MDIVIAPVKNRVALKRQYIDLYGPKFQMPRLFFELQQTVLL